MHEGWAEKLKEQASEGCNVSGRLRVNKVVGNINFSPGRSFRSSHDLVPYLRDDGNRHDFSHTIHSFAFEGIDFICRFSWFLISTLGDDDYNLWKAAAGKAMRNKLGLSANPLDNVAGNVCHTQGRKTKR